MLKGIKILGIPSKYSPFWLKKALLLRLLYFFFVTKESYKCKRYEENGKQKHTWNPFGQIHVFYAIISFAICGDSYPNNVG